MTNALTHIKISISILGYIAYNFDDAIYGIDIVDKAKTEGCETYFLNGQSHC